MTPADFNLLHNNALWLLLLIPPAALLLWRVFSNSANWSKVIDANLLPHLLSETGRGRRRPFHWLALAWLILTVMAMAGPSFEKIEVPVFQRADALVIILDLSASMSAADIQPSRVQRAKQKILDLLESRQEGVTGLVVYAGDAHVVAPLTDDRRTIENLLTALDPSIMPLPGSNATAALLLGSDLLSAAGVANGQLLLITDGMPKFDPSDILPALKATGAEVAILGVGTDTGAPIPRPDGGFLRSESGDIVVPRLDARELGRYAAALNGQFEPVALDNSDLDRLLTRTVVEDGEIALDRETDTWVDQGNWLALALGIALLPLFRRGALAVLFLVPLLAPDTATAQILDELWQTRDQQGAQALQQGDSATAAQLFEDPAWRGTAQYADEQWLKAADSFGRGDDADSLYNQGNALAKAGELNRALEAYDQALALEPNASDALRNRDLVEQLLQQQENQQSKGGDDGEQGEDNEAEQQDQQGSTAGSQGSDSQQQSSNDADSAAPQEGENSTSDSADQNEGSSDSQSQGDPSNGEQAGGNSATEGVADGQDALSDEMQAKLDAQTQEQMGKFDAGLEKQQALEQWLRRVPDDPGGLLQRKFRYETIQRLRRGEEPDEDVRW